MTKRQFSQISGQFRDYINAFPPTLVSRYVRDAFLGYIANYSSEGLPEDIEDRLLVFEGLFGLLDTATDIQHREEKNVKN